MADLLKGWEWHTDADLLCPKYNKAYKSILKDFMEGKSFTIY